MMMEKIYRLLPCFPESLWGLTYFNVFEDVYQYLVVEFVCMCLCMTLFVLLQIVCQTLLQLFERSENCSFFRTAIIVIDVNIVYCYFYALLCNIMFV